MNPLDQQHQARLYWIGVILYFVLFSFNAFATSTVAALIGVKWEMLTNQEKFLIIVAVVANWTGLVLVFIQNGMKRIVAGKPPINGDTDHITKAKL